MVRLWRNENLRIFYDRLINQEDRSFVNKQISRSVYENFQEHEEYVNKEPILFGDFRLAMQEETARLYEDLLDYSAIKSIFEEVLTEFNERFFKMNLVLFEDALQHLVRIQRIIRLNRGHALLIGVAGCGKRSLTKLASFAAGYSTFEIVLTRGYGEEEFRESLKQLYSLIGAGKPHIFLMSDDQVVHESFLEYVNNMLTNGFYIYYV